MPRQRGPLVLATTTDLAALNASSLHFLGLTAALHAQGHEVAILAPRPSGPLAATLAVDCARQFTPSVARFGLPAAAAIGFMVPGLRRLGPMHRLYVRSGVGTLALVRAARLVGFQRIVVEANGWFADDLAALDKSKGWQALAQRLQIAEAHAADAVRVVTAGIGRLFEAHGVPASKLHTIANGTNLAVFRPGDRCQARRAFGIADDATVLAFVGNLWPVIDLAVMFEAARQLAATMPRLEIHIVGDGVSRAAFGATSVAAVAAGVTVRWHGGLPPTAANDVLAAADVAVAPFAAVRNACSGLSPLKLYDYAAAGRIVVATDLPGIAELHAQPWLHLAAPHDASQFAAALANALTGDRTSAERAARGYAEANFGWNHVADRVSALLG